MGYARFTHPTILLLGEPWLYPIHASSVRSRLKWAPQKACVRHASAPAATPSRPFVSSVNAMGSFVPFPLTMLEATNFPRLPLATSY
jgi:hypothetical protein